MVGDMDGAQHTTSHVKGDEVLNIEAEAMTSSGKKHELMNVGLNKDDIRAILSPMLKRVKSTNNECDGGIMNTSINVIEDAATNNTMVKNDALRPTEGGGGVVTSSAMRVPQWIMSVLRQ